HDLGDRRCAQLAYELLLPYARLIAASRPAVSCAGSVSYYLGLLAMTLGNVTSAAEHLENALQAHRRLRSRPWVARSQCEHACALVARNRDQDALRASELGEQALATATELGVRETVERARAVAVQAREVAQRSERRAVGQVAELVPERRAAAGGLAER